MAKLFRKPSLPLVLTGCVSSLVLLFGMTPTFGAFTASLVGAGNTAGSGTIVMQESDSSGDVVCMSTDEGGVSVNSATCSSMNRYGANVGMHPGASVALVTYIENVGTVAASSFALTTGPCVESSAGASSGSATDFCSKISVTITSGPTTIFTGTAAALGGAGPVDLLSKLGLSKLPAGHQVDFTVTTTMDASLGNAYQGLKVSQPMTWTFSA